MQRRIQSNRRAPQACLVAIVAVVAVTAACGSSRSGSTTVPETAGLGLSRAMDALCASGVKVTVNTTPSQATGSPGTVRRGLGIVVTGTTPPAGHSVARGSDVILQDTEPEGMQAALSTTARCLAPIIQTMTISAEGQAAINAVAASSVGRAVAAQFPAMLTGPR